MDRLDPARTALVMVHMVKGVAGDVDTPFNRIFRHRAEETGIIGVQARLLDGFRTAKAKVVYTLVTYQPGFPGVRPNSPLFRTAIDANCLLEGTPAVEVMDELAPRPGEPVVGDRRPAGSTAPYSTPFSAWQASTPSCLSVWPPPSRSNPPRAVHATWDTGRSSSPTPAPPTATRPTPTRSTCSKSGSARHPSPTRSSAPWDSYRQASGQFEGNCLVVTPNTRRTLKDTAPPGELPGVRA
jgi:hypothetical protein